MKITTYILVLFLLIACTNTVDVQKQSNFEKTSLKEPEETNYKREKTQVIISNEANYSSIFIEELKNFSFGFKKVELIENKMIFDDTLTSLFPDAPTIGKRTTLTGIKDKIAIALTIDRINQTTIDYRIEIVEFGKKSILESGQANISPYFVLGSESDYNEITNEQCFVTEFASIDTNCYTYIRIGVNENKTLFGKVKKNCNETIKDINLDNFVTLIEK